jgi:hypothetical protein
LAAEESKKTGGKVVVSRATACVIAAILIVAVGRVVTLVLIVRIATAATASGGEDGKAQHARRTTVALAVSSERGARGGIACVEGLEGGITVDEDAEHFCLDGVIWDLGRGGRDLGVAATLDFRVLSQGTRAWRGQGGRGSGGRSRTTAQGGCSLFPQALLLSGGGAIEAQGRLTLLVGTRRGSSITGRA